MNWFLLIIGICIATVYSYFILPKKSSSNPTIRFTLYPFLYNSMILLPISKDKVLHIHHWTLFFLIMLFIPNPIIFGFSLTMVIQGLSYDNCFEFIENRPKEYN